MLDTVLHTVSLSAWQLRFQSRLHMLHWSPVTALNSTCVDRLLVFQVPFDACSIQRVCGTINLANHIERSNKSTGSFGEAQTGICELKNLSGVVLEKVIEYFYYNEKHKGSTGVPDMPDIPAELCLELLMAADYLDT